MLLRDRDAKFSGAFDSALRAVRVTPLRLPYRAPNLNAQAERLIETVQVECLDRFIALGPRAAYTRMRGRVIHVLDARQTAPPPLSNPFECVWRLVETLLDKVSAAGIA